MSHQNVCGMPVDLKVTEIVLFTLVPEQDILGDEVGDDASQTVYGDGSLALQVREDESAMVGERGEDILWQVLALSALKYLRTAEVPYSCAIPKLLADEEFAKLR